MKICFFCKIKRREILDIVEFYKQDIEALKKIDANMTIATDYNEIKWSADVIFIWWWTYALLPVIIGRLLGKKVIITGTFNYRCPEANSDYFRRPLWQRILIRLAVKFATTNIFVSLKEYNQIRAEWKYKNIIYSPHCIDTNKYFYNESNKRKNFLFTICWTGKENVKRKCLYEIIEAIEILNNANNKQIILYIAGHKGDAFLDIKNIIEKKGLSASVKLLGEISEQDKIEYLQNCYCYLQPSKYEGFGLAIAEAMSCGAPVITTDVGEISNVVGNDGIIIDNLSPERIAKAIEEVFNMDTRELSLKAHKRISTYYPIKRRSDELFKILHNS